MQSWTQSPKYFNHWSPLQPHPPTLFICASLLLANTQPHTYTQLLISNSYFTHLLQLPRFAINGNWGPGEDECKRCGWAYRRRGDEFICDENERPVNNVSLESSSPSAPVTFQRLSNRNSIQKLLVHFYNLTLSLFFSLFSPPNKLYSWKGLLWKFSQAVKCILASLFVSSTKENIIAL